MYQFNVAIYKQFTTLMRASTGCTNNREIMLATLQQIKAEPNGEGELHAFLSINYPYMIDGYVGQKKPIQNTHGELFPNFNPKLLTFPHRLIFEDQPGLKLDRRVKSFLIDKVKYDYIIIGDKAYIEYLNTEDSKIIDKIPLKNWLIAAYRQQNA